jgi:hypothetical protein
MPNITSKKFPHCSQLGVLRRNRGGYVVSTAALYRAVGWETYVRYLDTMEHASNSGGPTPESCEKFLEGLNHAT